MNLSMRVLAAGLVCAAATGCRKKSDLPRPGLAVTPGVYRTNQVIRSYQELGPDDVLVQVGRRALTKRVFQETVSERIELQTKANSKMTREEEDRLEQATRQYVFANFMARAAMLEEADARRVTPNEQDLKDADVFINQICRRLKVKRDVFARRFAGGEASVTQRIREEATLQAVIRSEFGELFDVKDESALNLKAELENRHLQSEETNKVYAAKLESVRSRLISGELKTDGDPKTVQALLPQDVTCEGVLTTKAFNLNFAQSREALARLKPGEWSPVVALDDTFDLYQLQALEPNPDPDLVVYTYLKFSVPRDIGWVVPDLAQLKKDIARNLRKQKQGPWVQGLITKYGVLYPNGVRLFSPAQSPAAGKTLPAPAGG